MNKIIEIDILAHADFAGCLRKNKRNPGICAYSAAIESVRQKNPQGTLLLDAGDEFCANYWGGQPVVEALNLLGTDVLTLGNHEFDWGKDFLEQCVSYGKFPMLCANVIEEATQDLPQGVQAYTIIERQGVKIGVLGLTTEYTPYMVKKGAFDPYKIVDSVKQCKKYLPQMRNEGAEIIIILSHFPFYINEDRSISGELAEVLERVSDVDVFIGGHISGDYGQTVGATMVLKAGFGGKSLAHARLFFDSETRKIVKKEGNIILTNRDNTGDPLVCEHALKVTAPFDDYFSEVFLTHDEKWTMKYSGESKLGNFLADVILASQKTDFAYINTTSSGGSIYPGPITVEDLTSVYGFNDEILTTIMSGQKIYDLFEHIYQPERFGNNATIAFSGIITYLDHTKEAGSKVVKITLPDGSPLDKDKYYKVASSEYMGLGGNDTTAIVADLKWDYSGQKYYDALFAYLRKQGKLLLSNEQRLYEIGTPENDNSPECT